MILDVGITGGIGSGKSTVCRIFESLGVAVYYADNEAKNLMNTHPEIISGLTNEFGPEVYIHNKLNRTFLSSQIFSNKKKLAYVNELVHPIVANHYLSWKQRLQKTDYSLNYALKEAAILFEAGTFKKSDFIISVYAPKALRLNRVIRRDKSNMENILMRMNNQWSDQRKI